MIPIFNSANQREFNLVLGRKFLRCCVQILKAFKASVAAIKIHNRDSQKYLELAEFISDVYSKYYKAEIKVGAPKIMAVIDQKNQAISALAIRPANLEKLFLEQYLDEPIEEVLSKKLGKKIQRREIVEIGSLASKRKHAAHFLYVALAAYLKARGYKYVVATGTDYLFKYFSKAHLHPKILARADKNKLIDQSTNWGTYYDSKPQVMSIDIDRGNLMLGGFLGITAVPCLNALYPAISYSHD